MEGNLASKNNIGKVERNIEHKKCQKQADGLHLVQQAMLGAIKEIDSRRKLVLG